MSIVVTSTNQNTDNANLADQSANEVNDSVSNQELEENTEESEISDVDQDTESDEGDDQDQEEQEQQEDEGKPKKKNGFGKRIKKLTSKISEKDREIEYWKSQALKSNPIREDNSEQSAFDTKTASKDQEPNPDDFESNAEYIRAYTKWELNQIESKKAEAESKKQAESKYADIQKGYEGKLNEFKKTAQDFDSVLEDFRESYPDFNPHPAVMEALMTSDLGPQVFYEVIKTPGEYERLRGMTPASVIRELGKIEAKVAAKIDSSKTQQKISKAPAPARPVGANGSAPRKSIFDKDISQSDYERMRREQMKRK